MEETYYSVEQIAALLHIHPKTIQRYIREGKLRANKIGKSWRVGGHDLSLFTESVNHSSRADDEGDNIPAAERIKISSVIDIRVYDREEAIRIVNALTAALNSKPPEYGDSSMHTQYIEQEDKVRVTLWGGISFMEAVIGLISGLAQPAEG